MNCVYCIARDLPRTRMSLNIGRRAIDLFVYLAQGCNSLEFVFTGGEPLLEVAALRYLTRYAEGRARMAGMNPHFVLKTNGSILSDSIVRFLRTHDFVVIVSIDGAPTVHDIFRRTVDGHGTNATVLRNLNVLRENGLSCVASVTVHPAAVGAVLENVRFLHLSGIDRIDIGPAYGTVSWTDADVDIFVESVIAVADYVREENSQGRTIEVSPLLRESQHIGGILTETWGCHAGSSNLAFLPTGEIAGCSALAMIMSGYSHLLLGDVFNGLRQCAIDRMVAVAQSVGEERESCVKCSIANDCTGGCLAINYSTMGKPFLPPQLYCKLIGAIPLGWCRAWGT